MTTRRKSPLTNSIADFERSFSNSKTEVYRLRLFVTGNTPNSARAVENAKRLCEKYLKDRYQLKVIDLYQQPALAKEHEIIAAPTLLKLEPSPVRRILGDLSNEASVLRALGVTIG